LAQNMDLKDAKYIGFMICANKTVWSKIPSVAVNYASSLVSDLAPGASGIFKGVYEVDIPEDCVKIYSFFSGLSLPLDRISELKRETAESQSKIKVNEEKRNINLQLDTGKTQSVSAAQDIKNKIAQKNSTFGKFVSGTSDRRK